MPSRHGTLRRQRVRRQPPVGALPPRRARRPKPVGGDRNSRAIRARAELILPTSEREPRLFLRERPGRLAEWGVQTSTSGRRASSSDTESPGRGAPYTAEREVRP